MTRALLAAAVVLAVVPFGAVAHHKPGHNPPGQLKQLQRTEGLERPFSTGQLERESDLEALREDRDARATSPMAGELDWGFYQDPDYGFTVEVPIGLMEQLEEAPRGSRFIEAGGGGQLDVYGGANSRSLKPDEIAAELTNNPQIGRVTYRASGSTWIVLSGYYSRPHYDGDDLIFYTKFMFNEDRSRLSAFEISYPAAERRRYDPIVERLEETLSPPQ